MIRPSMACAIALAIGCLACENPLTLDDLREPVEPRATYRLIWKDVRACSGRTRDFEGIRWFVTPRFPDQPDVLGQWNSRREITVRSDVQFDPDVVGHEILHDLLHGDHDHADPAWEDCELPLGSRG